MSPPAAERRGETGGLPRLRAFVGIRLPEPLVPGYAALQQQLRLPGVVKWVERQNLHLTLKFLGSVDRHDLARLGDTLGRAAAAAAPSALSARRLTAFPHERAARVLVVELEDASGAVLRLQQGIESELGALGVPREERPFRTHLTLGRVKQGSVDARAALAGLRPPPGEWAVRSFELFESRLGPAGPSYTVLRSFGLD